MPTRRAARAVVSAVVTAVTAAGAAAVATTSPSAAAAAQPPVALRSTSTGVGIVNPTTNVAPSPSYWQTCSQSGVSSQACIDAVVAAIDHARSLEGVKPLSLPAGFATLSPAVQTFVVSNLERVDRGLQPASGMVDTLNTLAGNAAVNDADPVLSSWTVGPFSANRWGSNWAGDLNALAADYDWMYNDGWGPSGSYNLDCTSSTASGCWGHRDNILSSYGGESLITGVGSVKQSQWTSIAQIFVAGSGTFPSFTQPWSAFATAAAASLVPGQNATSAVTSVTSLITAGSVGHVAATFHDATTGLPLAGAAVSLCRRAAPSTTVSCASYLTNTAGGVSVPVGPRISTYYWFAFGGSTGHAATITSKVLMRVRASLRLSAAHLSTGWRIVARINPARGQTVRLQRHTSTGWTTLRRTVAASSMSFSRLRAGSYRVLVSSVPGSVGTSRSVRAG